jgi:3D (Asp-Asp-Asp) domain-containing protein
MQKYIITLASIIFISFGIFIIPKFMDFMENQNDILKIKNDVSQTFEISITEKIVENKKVDFNVPIPKDIQEKMMQREKAKKEAERLEKERLARIEAERIEKEKQEQIRLEKEKEEKAKAVQIAKTTNRSEEIPRNNSGWVTFTATAYCGCAKCCGKSTGRTASGTMATQGRTVAMPSSYKFGTKIEIQGMGNYVVEDRGGAIKGNRIDIFFSNHQSALNFGKKTINLRVVQ